MDGCNINAKHLSTRSSGPLCHSFWLVKIRQEGGSHMIGFQFMLSLDDYDIDDEHDPTYSLEPTTENG